jgi:hypothetical protein
MRAALTPGVGAGLFGIVRMRKLALTALVIAGVAAGVSGARTQGEPLLVVSPRVDLKWSSVGRLLGWLGSGARVEKAGGQGGWTRVQVRGWMPTASLEPAGARQRVKPFEESLHDAPRGEAFGGLRQSVEVTVLSRQGDWSEVQTIGWLPDGAVAPAVQAEAAAAPADTLPPPASEPAPRETPPTASAVGRLARGVELRSAPEGAGIATVPAGTVVTALETRGGWTRVAVQGWVPSAVVEAGRADDVRPEVVAAAAADAVVGRRMTWTIEHISLQRADRLRRDFRVGELFALARVPGASGIYVYLAVPERLAETFQDLAPFATVRVTGRVRTGRSELTGNPILDLERVLP